ncbi:MAG: hypothetical protein ACJA2C_000286 [Marinoscillum sp.]|jgi:hypothetical protein
MLSTKDIDIYTQYSIPIWKKYCARHGYNFYHFGEKLIPDMAFTWSRIKMIQDHFKVTKADYVVMVDADTFIYQNQLGLSLESLIDKHMTNQKQILFQKDGSNTLGIYFSHNFKLSWELKRWTLPNAGFNIMKNSADVRSMIDEWLTLGQGKLRHLADVHPRTQNVLLRGVMQEPKYDNIIGYLPSEIVSKRNTKFCKHLSAMSKEQIAEGIKIEYDKHDW